MDYKGLIDTLDKIEKGCVFSIGKSFLGREIFAVYYDFGAKDCVIIQGAIHAREFVTTDLIIDLCGRLESDFCSYLGRLPNLIFVPMVNPDGVEICHNNRDVIEVARGFCGEIGDLKLWKANARGVDLNNNFDARFGMDPRYVTAPAAHGYPGVCPESEPETMALVGAVKRFDPIFSISYHSKGEEIYYDFHLNKPQEIYHRKNAEFFSKSLRYKLVGGAGNSCGGFKDYCVMKLKIPSITIEVGQEKYSHPLPKAALCDIIKKHRGFFDALKKSYTFILNNRTRF